MELKGAYEDRHSVNLVMELCAGGELFDRIIAKGHYSERAAANLCRQIVTVVHNCHTMGVMHRDLKPENFLFLSTDENSPLKATDFGLSVFFKQGTSGYPVIIHYVVCVGVCFPFVAVVITIQGIVMYDSDGNDKKFGTSGI